MFQRHKIGFTLSGFVTPVIVPEHCAPVQPSLMSLCAPAVSKQLGHGAQLAARHVEGPAHLQEASGTGYRSGVIQLTPVVTPSLSGPTRDGEGAGAGAGAGAAARLRPCTPLAHPHRSIAATRTHARTADGSRAALQSCMRR